MKKFIFLFMLVFLCSGSDVKGLEAELRHAAIKKYEWFLKIIQDIPRIRIGITTEKEILDRFGEPHVIIEEDEIKDLREGKESRGISEEDFSASEPGEKIFIYGFWDNSASPYDEFEVLKVTIDKDKGVIKDIKSAAFESEENRVWYRGIQEDIRKIQIGVTTEEEILSQFGEPHVLIEGNVAGDLRKKVENDCTLEEFYSNPGLNEKFFIYGFKYYEYSSHYWCEPLKVIIEKDTKLVKNVVNSTFEDEKKELWLEGIRQDIAEIQKGITTEQEILDRFGEPHVIIEEGETKDLREGKESYGIQEKDFSASGPDERILIYGIGYGVCCWQYSCEVLKVTIDKDRGLVKAVKSRLGDYDVWW